MKQYRNRISKEVAIAVDLEWVETEYLKKIHHYTTRYNYAASVALKMARQEMMGHLQNKHIKKSDIVHMLHCIRVEVYPIKNLRCGCH